MSVLSVIAKIRAEAKAQVKAAEAKAVAEVKSAHKDRLRQQKLLARQEQRLIKAEEKGLKARRKHEKKLAKTQLQKQREAGITGKKVRSWAGTARVLIPLALPLVYRGIVAIQQGQEDQRARKAGVSPELLAKHSGHGATLKARIEGLRLNIQDADLPTGFKQDVRDRLDKLTAAVDNAEYMTPAQRRRAHASINGDIDVVAGEIQQRLRS